MGAGLEHDAQRIGAAEAAAERLRLGGKARLLDELTRIVKNAHLGVAVAQIQTHGHLLSSVVPSPMVSLLLWAHKARLFLGT